jgi:hypothetical protein
MVTQTMVSLIEMGAPPQAAKQMGICVADLVIKNITGVCAAPSDPDDLQLTLDRCFSRTDKAMDELKERLIMGAMACEQSLGR